MSKLVEKAKIAAMSKSLTKAWEYLGKNPEENIPKIMNLVDKVAPAGWYESQSCLLYTTCRGPFFLTRLPPAICIVRDAGLQNTATV